MKSPNKSPKEKKKKRRIYSVKSPETRTRPKKCSRKKKIRMGSKPAKRKRTSTKKMAVVKKAKGKRTKPESDDEMIFDVDADLSMDLVCVKGSKSNGKKKRSTKEKWNDSDAKIERFVCNYHFIFNLFSDLKLSF